MVLMKQKAAEQEPTHTTFNPPRMTMPTKSPKSESPKVWRMVAAELDEVMTWLLPSLMERWPRLSEDGVVWWLKSAMASKDTIVCRSKNVVAVAFASSDVLEPKPVVQEKFIRSYNAGKTEADDVRKFIRDWARDIGAVECHLT